MKQSHGGRGDMVNAAAKVEALKDELDANTTSFQANQDSLATEMLSFVSKEHEISDWVSKVSTPIHSKI